MANEIKIKTDQFLFVPLFEWWAKENGRSYHNNYNALFLPYQMQWLNKWKYYYYHEIPINLGESQINKTKQNNRQTTRYCFRVDESGVGRSFFFLNILNNDADTETLSFVKFIHKKALFFILNTQKYRHHSCHICILRFRWSDESWEKSSSKIYFLFWSKISDITIKLTHTFYSLTFKPFLKSSTKFFDDPNEI